MSPIIRSRRLRVVMLALLAPHLGACQATQHVELGPAVSLKEITGVTTRAGKEVRFSEPGAMIVRDTLYAVGTQGQVIIPTDSIKSVSVRQFSAGLTVMLVLVVGAVIGVAANSISQMKIGP